MHIEVLTRAAARTFEELCFIDAQPVTAESHRGPTRAAYVRFRGPFARTLSVRLPEPALREAAENMLGPEALETAGTLDDVVREITNIVCGHVLPLVGGKGAVFDISAPSMIEGTPAVDPTHELAELSVLGQIASISLAVDLQGT